MAGLFQAASKQRNPLGTTIRTHGSGKYTFGLALSAGQYPRSACLFLSAPRGMRHLPDQCHQLHHRLLRFQKLGCQHRLALDAGAGCDSGRRVPALHGASTGKPTILIQAGRTEEGFAVLEHIIGTEQARLRTDDIHASVKLETEMSHEFHDLFRPGLRKALVIGALIKA